MVFSTSIFLFFFLPLVILGYYVLKENYRIYFLLLASLFFYAWGEPRYVLVMLASIIINYVSGLLIHATFKKAWLSKFILVFAIACNLGILYYFKYLGFTLDTVNRILGTSLVYRDIVLPIGISFFIFQGMSYVIDLYRGKVTVQKNPALTAFYISFFPQLMAGPIVRYSDIEKQLYARETSPEKFVSGVRRFIIGLSKKVIIANNLGYVADLVFANPATGNTADIAWLGIVCYTFQIYFDFSGYSDMAIGLGRMFGFEFLENFNYPYISKTITEFWRRWHISLSSWFKDYVYIPLGGNRKGNVYANLFFVFALTGFWHGASFQFLVWGLWHGFFLVIERPFKAREVRGKALVPLRYALTMLIVMTGWVFFRSPDLRYALNYLGIMFGLLAPDDIGITLWYYLSPKVLFTLCLAVIASTPMPKLISARFHHNAVWRYAAAALMLVLFFVSLVFVVASSYNPFIYFRF
ncbi:alginate O-acetylation protein [Betaproteobacteria bacterium]|nr:alginate O-acetylation protein [Betaproteobacteria bacterium]